MAAFEHPEYDGHELVQFVSDEASGLRAIIAVHSTVLGPAGGGIRMYPYADSSGALTDVLRLSKAMSYKFAMAGLPVGGGKAVIIGDPPRDKTEELLEAFGREVDRLGGKYTCAEDVGTTPEDMVVINRVTQFVVGLPGKSGDTSPLTGYGVYHAMRAAAHHALGRDGLQGLKVAVQGAGNVGRHLCKYLAEAGAEIVIADIDEAAVKALAGEVGASSVSPGAILSCPCDILAPCALGAVLDDETIPAIQAKIVCGGANNQLAATRHGLALHERGILYAPDYVVNAGGVYSGSREITGAAEQQARTQVEGIYDTCLRVFAFAGERGIASSEAADTLAREAIEAAAKKDP